MKIIQPETTTHVTSRSWENQMTHGASVADYDGVLQPLPRKGKSCRAMSGFPRVADPVRPHVAWNVDLPNHLVLRPLIVGNVSEGWTKFERIR